ncbi:MAG: alanine--tRNA ligase, partial [Dehalococcoidia bacterium]|nr:alanine--tRNA ligase [Dehalococcoidia bacterium]
ELRTAFLAFFEERGHRRIPSSPLVPHGDPSLLFTSAGMVQFKPYFMGLEQPPARRMTSVQKCFRTTDVEEVGDASHLTFFEMLGNFSIADYFKPEVIPWAWEFLTGVLKVDPERLYATVFTDDDEAYELWRGLGVPERRLLRYTSEQGNYWYSGETGPSGPCSELHYDFGKVEGCASCAEDRCHPDVGCGRFLEIWNLVFMAYDRQPDGSRVPLPGQNIDTGAGIERVAWVLQGVRSVYETDQLRSILARAEAVSGRRYEPDEQPEVARALRAITEHARAVTFLIADGVLPANEGRGYVLRRVLRRAVYFAHTIGLREAFFGTVVNAAIDASLGAHPGLAQQREFIVRVVGLEEARFQQALTRGLELLDEVLEREQASKRVPGREMFTLYDTHGLPPELTIEVAAQRGYAVDREGFEAEMAAQRVRSRGKGTFGAFEDARAERYAMLGLTTEFVGYETLEASSTVTHILAEGVGVERLSAGEAGELVLPRTTLYPEGGGQVGDHGEIVTATGRFRVDDTQRTGAAISHAGNVSEGYISVGDAAATIVDPSRRVDSARNHTATHLLHAALRAVLGTHVRQAGSYVGPDRLRFDYTHPESPSPAALRQVQHLVNAKVREDIVRETIELPYEDAIARGAIAFFEDRYAADVRMVEYCEVHAHNPGAGHTHGECFSRELCGGTHLHSTGGVGMLVIVSDASIGAGMRRIEAVTGPEAERYIEERLDVVDSLAFRFKAPADEITARIDALEAQLAEERRQSTALARRASAGVADELVAAAEAIGGAYLVVARIEAEDADAMRALGDRLRDRLQPAVIVLGAAVGDRPLFLAMVSDELIARGVRADELARAAATEAGGGGGGRPQLAQAGGRDLSKLDNALYAARVAARERLTAG